MTAKTPVKMEPRKYYCTMERPMGLEKHVWNRIWLGAAHFFGAFGIYNLAMGIIPRPLLFFLLFYGYLGGTGITVGCHRYWTHKTFKAKLPLQIMLMYMQTAAAQYPIFKWSRDHRIHHKFVETDADPHDARRGFWYAHVGWLLVKEHPSVKEKEALIDFSDLDNDPVVRFQTKYWWYLKLIAVFIVPMTIAHWLYPQLALFQLFCANYVWYLTSLHFTWLVNSAAHMYGMRPYDRGHAAADNWFVSLVANGEGWHNYHHTFPWDYKTAELGLYKLNWSTMYIDFFAWVGLAYDLKTVPMNVVLDRVNRTGDGSHRHAQNANNNNSKASKGGKDRESVVLPPWGWGDEDIPEDHYQVTESLMVLKAQ